MHGSTELGILFALGTAFSWATAGIIHTAIARRIGVQGVLLLRQPVAALALGAACLLSGVPLFVPDADTQKEEIEHERSEQE